jgi:hypothetical protein
MPVWLENEEQVGLVHDPARDRSPTAAEDAGGERMVVADLALGLERRDHGRAELLRQRDHLGHARAGAVADDDHRALRRLQEPQRVVDRLGRRRDPERRDAAVRTAGLCIHGRRQRLHLVGEDQVRDVAPQQRVLAREVHQLDRVGVVQHGLAPGGDGAERAREVDLLERAGTEHLRVHLAGEREHRRTIDLRVPQAGEQVRGARPRDRQARRGPSGELAVRGRGERGGALVADADELQPPGLLLAAQRVGEPEVGVADHPEDVLDAPVDHRLDHEVGDRGDVRLLLDADVDLAVADLERVGRGLVVEAG